jgi:ArsR family metal-binding transcriptional regulator
MAVVLKKPCRRIVNVVGKEKPFIITIYPEGIISVREKSARDEYEITVDNIIKLAEIQEAKEQKEREEREAKEKESKSEVV